MRGVRGSITRRSGLVLRATLPWHLFMGAIAAHQQEQGQAQEQEPRWEQEELEP